MINPLTHLPLDKMDAILADDILKCIFLHENERIPIQISLKFLPRSPIDNKPALNVQVITWTNDGPVYGRIYAALRGGELNWCHGCCSLVIQGAKASTAIILT